MDREQLCGSLIIWLNTFNCDGPSETPEELTDGIAMSKVLHTIAPQFFDEAWKSKLKTDTNSNWRLRVSNLKKILKGILDYYSEVLGQQIQDFHMPDVTAIGEKNDIIELGRLLQLILGCAVNCEDKQEYIQRIMGMEESVQHMVMQAIQELMTKESPASKDEANTEMVEQLKKTVEDLNKAVEEKEEIAQRCHELDLQIAALQDEKSSLEQENERLNERVHQADSLEDPSLYEDWPEFLKSTPAGRRYQQLNHQVEQLQEELYKQEASKEDLRIKVELQDKEILDLHQKNEELTSLAEEARSLKDEIDVLRHTADKVGKYEASIDSYKKKLEELGDLKGQIKILEEKNTTYMQTNMELEEEVRKLSTFKSQLEIYKRQVQELQMKSSEEIKRADKAEFESKRLTDKMATIQREKERLSEENMSLKDTIEELRGTRAQQEVFNLDTITEPKTPDTLFGDGDADLDSPTSLGMSSLPPEVKERLIRLQHENKMLRLQKSSNDEESSQLLQTMLDDSNVRKNELETEVRILNQRILELTAQVEDLQENQQKVSASQDSSSAEIRNKLTEQINKCKRLDNELHQKRLALEETEPKMALQEDKIKDLELALGKKNDEMKQMEERYKKYLDKAKGVIQSLDPKKSPGTGPEIVALRNQLSEKDRLIDHLEKDHEKAKNIREQEEKLMVTAWYNLGMQLHRKAAEERLINSGAGQSFLARQRQAQTRRPPSVSSPPHISNMAGAR